MNTFPRPLVFALVLLTPTLFSEAATAADRNQTAPQQKQVELKPFSTDMPPLPEGVFEASEVTRPPLARVQDRPFYPVELRTHGIEGEALVLFTVTVEGKVAHAMVLRCNDIRFGASALEAVRRWEFRPAKLDREKVACRLVVPVRFSVKD